MIQIFRADFGPQSADSSSDEPLESESDEGLQRVWEAFDCWAESAMWVNGALAQMRTNMFLWCVCVCVFHGCVFDYTRDWVCVYLCVCSWSAAASFIRPIQLQWDECLDLQPSAVKHMTLLKSCLLTSDQPVVSLSCRQTYVPAGPGRLTHSM